MLCLRNCLSARMGKSRINIINRFIAKFLALLIAGNHMANMAWVKIQGYNQRPHFLQLNMLS